MLQCTEPRRASKKIAEVNNPNLIVTLSSKQFLDSGIQIYLDVGDDDTLLLFGPMEHFHRDLWNAVIKHEYHIVHGADHIGRTLALRSRVTWSQPTSISPW